MSRRGTYPDRHLLMLIGAGQHKHPFGEFEMDDERLKRIELENSLLRLDMEWEKERQQLLVPFWGSEPGGPPTAQFVIAALLFLGSLIVGAVFGGERGNVGA